jgi:hypothetical protein
MRHGAVSVDNWQPQVLAAGSGKKRLPFENLEPAFAPFDDPSSHSQKKLSTIVDDDAGRKSR